MAIAPRSRSGAVLSTFLGSSFATLIAAVQAILLMPLMLDSVGSRVYGGWLATGELLAWMLAFDFGIPNLLIQRIGAAHSKDDLPLAGRLFATGFAGLAMLAGVMVLFLLPLAWAAPQWVGMSPQEARIMTPCLLVSAIATVLTVVNYAFHGLARALQNTTLMNGFNVGGTLLGFVATWVLLSMGYGLWSIAWGLVLRSSVGLLGGGFFLAFGTPREFRAHVRVDRALVPEFAKLSPPMFVSGIAYALMTNSQVFLAACLLGPEVAVIFGITRKAADLCRSLLDVVGYASYGGFAHLAAAGDPVRTRRVFGEVQSAYLAMGCALLGAYAWSNPSLVSVWVGADRFGGPWLTAMMAISTLTAGWAYLTISLYRGLGHLLESSKVLLIECAVRIPVMAVLAIAIGPLGLAIGAIVTALASGRWTIRQVDTELGRPQHAAWLAWVGRAVVLIAGFIGSFQVPGGGWASVILGGLVFVGVAGGMLVSTDPKLRTTVSRARNVLMPRRMGASHG